MDSIKQWLFNKLHFLKHGGLEFPDTETMPLLLHKWSLKSPFPTWNVYSKVSLLASITCFILFIAHRSWSQLNGDRKALSRRTMAPGFKVYEASRDAFLGSCLQAFAVLLVMSLFVSIPWEWVRLYQIEVAKKTTVLSEGYGNSCSAEGLSFWRTIKTWLSWHFSWHSDACEDYYKALLVDPFWEVTPVMAISSAIGRIIQHPVELMAQTIGRSIRNTMKEIPSQWQPVIFLLSAIVFVTVLVTYFRRQQRIIIACQVPPANTRSRTTKHSIHSLEDQTTASTKTRHRC